MFLMLGPSCKKLQLIRVRVRVGARAISRQFSAQLTQLAMAYKSLNPEHFIFPQTLVLRHLNFFLKPWYTSLPCLLTPTRRGKEGWLYTLVCFDGLISSLWVVLWLRSLPCQWTRRNRAEHRGCPELRFGPEPVWKGSPAKCFSTIWVCSWCSQSV